jgi:hypothetical protein
MKMRLTNLPCDEVFMCLLETSTGFKKDLEKGGAGIPIHISIEYLFSGCISGIGEAGLLPDWWNAEIQRECESFAASKGYQAEVKEVRTSTDPSESSDHLEQLDNLELATIRLVASL